MILGIFGSKGGVGKTSLSIALASVLGVELEEETYILITDINMKSDILPSRKNVEYLDLDENEKSWKETLQMRIEAAKKENIHVIIDGGANRQIFDNWMSQFCDVILLPITPDSLSINIALHDSDVVGHDKVLFVPNRWPTNPARKIRARKFIQKIFEQKGNKECVTNILPQSAQIEDFACGVNSEKNKTGFTKAMNEQIKKILFKCFDLI